MKKQDRLIVFGCSNTYGHGLSDCIRGIGYPGHSPSKIGWPNHLHKWLFKHKDYRLINKGFCGASNKRIWHNALRYDYKKTDLVVVMWSFLGRYAILEDEKIQGTPMANPRLTNIHYSHVFEGITYLPQQADKYFFEEIFRFYDAEISTVLYMSHLHYFLKEKGIKLYNLYVDEDGLKQSSLDVLPKDINLKMTPFHSLPYHLDIADDGVHPGPKSHEKMGLEIYKWIKP